MNDTVTFERTAIGFDFGDSLVASSDLHKKIIRHLDLIRIPPHVLTPRPQRIANLAEGDVVFVPKVLALTHLMIRA